MRSVLGLMEKMKSAGAIEDYALGGGIAAQFYVKAPATTDIDFFVTFSSAKSAGLDFMSPVYEMARQEGAEFTGHRMVYDGQVVDFVSASDELVREAVRNKVFIDHEGLRVPIVTQDYLYLIAKKVGRPKDKERMQLLYPLRSSHFPQLLKKYFNE